MGIENSNDLQPRLEDIPFFENLVHCESWVDEALLLLEAGNLQGVEISDIEKMKNNLQYAKELLNGEDYPPQKEIDARFRPLVRVIMENQELWGELGSIYTQVWNYLARKLAEENQ